MNKSTAIMKKIKPYLVKYWVAMMWSFLFMRLTVGIFWSYENRFFFHWQRTDAVAVFLAIAIMAFLVFAGYHMFACFGKVGRYFARVAFVCLTLFYLKVNIFETIEAYDCPLYVNITSKILLLALVLVSLRYIERARRVCRAVLLIVSPILVIYASVLFAARPVKASYQAELGENISSVVSARPVDKICFIVMDEWSYDRLFDAGRVREEYPNVECLASQSFVFHQAYSPAGMTLDSLPSLIMGIKGNLAVREDGLLFRSDNSVKHPDEYDHIFKKMKMLGYFTELTGNYFPYAEVVGTGIDSGYSANIYKLFGDKICVNAMLFILDNFRIRLSFLSPVRRVYNMAKNCYFDSITFVIQKRCLAMISGGRKMFGMFHYTVPHPPMSFNRHGIADFKIIESSSSITGYEGNLAYVDTLVKDILATGLTNTMLIVTSDHSWRFDPELESGLSETSDEVRHVPMFVHLPGQRKRVDINKHFENVNTGEMIYRYLTGRKELIEIIEEFQ